MPATRLRLPCCLPGGSTPADRCRCLAPPLPPRGRALGQPVFAPTRGALLAGCVSLWALRLGGYLFYRVIKVRQEGRGWGLGEARPDSCPAARAAGLADSCLSTLPTLFPHPPMQVGKDARLDQFFQQEGEPLLSGPSK